MLSTILTVLLIIVLIPAATWIAFLILVALATLVGLIFSDFRKAFVAGFRAVFRR